MFFEKIVSSSFLLKSGFQFIFIVESFPVHFYSKIISNFIFIVKSNALYSRIICDAFYVKIMSNTFLLWYNFLYCKIIFNTFLS